MRQRLILLTAGLVATLGLLAGWLTLDSDRAAAAPPCFVPLFTASSGNALAICPNAPPCGTSGSLTVIAVGPPGTVGVAACGSAQVACTVGIFLCTNTVPAGPGATFACGVIKPPGPFPPASATCFG